MDNLSAQQKLMGNMQATSAVLLEAAYEDTVEKLLALKETLEG